MIDIPQLRPAVVVEELEDRVGDVDQRLQDVGDRDHASRLPVVLGRIDWADAQGEPLRHRVEAAVAEGIAAQQAPGGEQQAAYGAETPNRLRLRKRSRSARTGSGAVVRGEIQR